MRMFREREVLMALSAFSYPEHGNCRLFRRRPGQTKALSPGARSLDADPPVDRANFADLAREWELMQEFPRHKLFLVEEKRSILGWRNVEDANRLHRVISGKWLRRPKR
jgi:hypothetical protein